MKLAGAFCRRVVCLVLQLPLEVPSVLEVELGIAGQRHHREDLPLPSAGRGERPAGGRAELRALKYGLMAKCRFRRN